jgi:hypothetical protein
MRISTNRLECAAGCPDILRIERETVHAFGVDDIYAALVESGVYLGWRRNLVDGKIYCPQHAYDLKLVCARCNARECFCMGGPRFDARPGDPEDTE